MIVQIDAAKRKELETVNARINALIIPETDQQQYGSPDFWAVAETAGDCEDYALRKRQELRALGWAPDGMDIAVCRLVTTGEYHAVLVVHTSEGDLVLDNRASTVRAWNNIPGYHWVMTGTGGSIAPDAWRKAS